MPIFLTLITIATIGTIFYTPIPTPFIPIMHIVAIGFPIILLLTQILALGRKNSKEAAQGCRENTPTTPDNAAAITTTHQDIGDAAVVQFLGRLQDKGRIVDFIMDDIALYDNESVGAAARIVHQGCSELLKTCFTIKPIYPGEEMDMISLADHYDSCTYRLSGNIPSAAPYTGQVLHRGWKTTHINLPQIIKNTDNLEQLHTIIAPVEVEID